MENRLEKTQHTLIMNLEASHKSECQRREFERLAKLEYNKVEVLKQEITQLYSELQKLEEQSKQGFKKLAAVED